MMPSSPFQMRINKHFIIPQFAPLVNAGTAAEQTDRNISDAAFRRLRRKRQHKPDLKFFCLCAGCSSIRHRAVILRDEEVLGAGFVHPAAEKKIICKKRIEKQDFFPSRRIFQTEEGKKRKNGRRGAVPA
jgi:hypothetical protein